MADKAVFLDRDGVINPCPPFVNKARDFKLLPQVEVALQRLKDDGYDLHIVTNQGGVAFGHMTEEELSEINFKTMELLPMIDTIQYCTHHPNEHCGCRKPQPGMISRVLEEGNYDPTRCWMIGDQETDMMAAKGAGIPIQNIIIVPSNSANLVVVSALIRFRGKK